MMAMNGFDCAQSFKYNTPNAVQIKPLRNVVTSQILQILIRLEQGTLRSQVLWRPLYLWIPKISTIFSLRLISYREICGL